MSHIKNKTVIFSFLSPKSSAIVSSIIMIAICNGTFFLNIMINEEIGKFLLYIARIFGVCVMITLVLFIIGLAINKMSLIKQFTTFFAVYIFFSLSCFCCNFTTVLFGDSFRESYNLYTVYADFYYDRHPDEENIKYTEDQIKKYYRISFYIGILLHIISLFVMIYYYMVTSAYIHELYKENSEYKYKFNNYKISNENNRDIEKTATLNLSIHN